LTRTGSSAVAFADVQPRPGRADRLPPSAGLGKGQLENQLGLVPERFFTPPPRFRSDEDMNGWLLDRCLRPDHSVAESKAGGETSLERCLKLSALFLSVPTQRQFQGGYRINHADRRELSAN
jgi:hypothetical protein